MKMQMLALAQEWREAAHKIQEKHGAEAPQQVKASTEALETCADQLEELARKKHYEIGLAGDLRPGAPVIPNPS